MNNNIEKNKVELYAVGDIYITLSDDDPKDRFGGKWEKIEGRFLLGSSATYKLNHTAGTPYIRLGLSGSQYCIEHSIGPYSGNLLYWLQSNTASEGVSVDIPHIPPYLAVNIWKRVE